ncbi:MAG: peptide-methionine (S)-S-oxide reductase MsrA [Nitrososphaeria archaeon]|jgi:peptide-methionine (S)-S-oxide reductase
MNPEQLKISGPQREEVVTLGGGCFWCMEAVFNEIKGVVKVESGYSGGNLEYPSYEQVSSGTTGHAEVVQVRFDPDVISFKEILDIFFATHDPTTPNRQGNDVGTQYRSIILYHNDEQKSIAGQVIQELDSEKTYSAPIVTQVESFKAFYAAEEYHRDYFKRHPEQPYCRIIITPKINKLQKYYVQKLKILPLEKKEKLWR